jgi:hypothetical protein
LSRLAAAGVRGARGAAPDAAARDVARISAPRAHRQNVPANALSRALRASARARDERTISSLELQYF